MRILIVVILSFWASMSLQAQEWKNKIDAEIWADARAGAEVEVIIAFKEQADLSPAYALKTKEEKGAFVYQALQETATESQRAIKALLDNAAQAYHSLLVVNALYTRLDADLLEQIAKQDEVKNVQANPWSAFDAPTPDRSLEGSRGGMLEWGLDNINANDVWDLGFTGAGVVVGGQDTGYEWDHPVIKDRYRGWDGTTANHDYHWHDAIREINLLNDDPIVSPDNNPCGLDSEVPCDDHNHGTHTMGTMVGGEDEDGVKIGVAPEAQWIGCRNMERGWGSPFSYIECFEWFLAPTNVAGDNPDPSMAPHVINNSWGCPEVEGCNASNFELMETAVNALRAAGVVVVVSAGNSGPSCHSISNPAAIFEGSFTIGASNSSDSIANFSSRGSVNVDGSLRLKPNVVAPGVGVRSAVRGGGYATWNGTSMAGPHVAGAVALMISAVPELAGQVDTIEAILQETALPILSEQDCEGFPGMAVPNATYGYGRINVFEAVQRAMQTVVSTDETIAHTIEVFPNPANEVVWVKGLMSESPATFLLYDANGRQLLQQTIENGLDKVNIATLAAGVYWYTIKAEQHIQTAKIVVQ